MQEFKRMKVEEEERKKQEAENTSGWTNIGKQEEVITELDASKLNKAAAASYQIETPAKCDTEETNVESP